MVGGKAKKTAPVKEYFRPFTTTVHWSAIVKIDDYHLN